MAVHPRLKPRSGAARTKFPPDAERMPDAKTDFVRSYAASGAAGLAPCAISEDAALGARTANGPPHRPER